MKKVFVLAPFFGEAGTKSTQSGEWENAKIKLFLHIPLDNTHIVVYIKNNMRNLAIPMPIIMQPEQEMFM